MTRRPSFRFWICALVLSLPFSGAWADGGDDQEDRVRLISGDMSLEWDLRVGQFDLFGRDGGPLLRNATSAVMSSSGAVLTSDARYARSSAIVGSGDPVVGGRCLVVTCRDQERMLDLELRITLLGGRQGAVLELLFTNVSKEDVLVPFCEPLRAATDEGGGCLFGAHEGASLVDAMLTNGWIYYDSGQLLAFSPATSDEEVISHWNAAFHVPTTQATLVVGYLDNSRAEGVIAASWVPAGTTEAVRAAFNLAARSLYNGYFVVKPGFTVSSGRLLFLVSPDRFNGLETYADLVRRLYRVRLNPVINGWCSWFVTYGDVTEKEVLRHAECVARELKPYGMEWVQVDDGYQTAFGNWEGNNKFPHGMKWLAGRIREMGLKPGIWVAPYAISADTDVAKKHPEWLVQGPDGEPQRIVPEHQQQAQYILDVTHPGARKWLEGLFHTLAREWGYDFIKTDFVEWTLLAAERYADPTVSKAQAYRTGCQIMREAIGPDRHLLDCGPGPVVVGLIDSMRIELDRPSPPFTVWEHYAGWPNSVIPSVAKRYYLHNRMWINDADHLRTRDLSIPQAQAAATSIALSGGTTISGDPVADLDPERLAITRRILPAYGETARPLDLFDRSLAETFVLTIRKPFGQWWLVGCFNGETRATTRELDPVWLGLSAERTYLVSEFWSQRLISETKGPIRLALEPTSVQLLCIRERQGVPQVLGTDRHFTQGAVELAEVRWDTATKTLSGVALGKPGMEWMLSVYVPAGYSIDESPAAQSGLSDIGLEVPVLRGRLRFEAVERKEWSLRFKGSST
ncbi:MAG TPA: alpha-galactosidase [Phycisphaerae bacterium]|nr:alpha-galactosidase [Phycisphaerae bacterium]HRY69874.1 alpha-galactosidase [Phycisphaerae bacterium]HSA25399.1 alpha-galactosidase [Phycisphaerae bacterium]